tara:strand:- start:13491 stop:13730 length:240 start_codon:yes stop_codon:yes gene_type:complete
MMGLHEYDEKPLNKTEAYETLYLEDVLEAVRWIKWSVSPDDNKVEAIKYVEHWKKWCKVNDKRAYDIILQVQNSPENIP